MTAPMRCYRVYSLKTLCWIRSIVIRQRCHLHSKNNTPYYKATYSIENDKRLTFQHGTMANLATGSTEVKLGDTSVLVTTVWNTSAQQRLGFFPLTVDYRHTSAAAGRIPANFLRRELAPTEKEIITSRMIDRSLRPLFPDGMNGEMQVTCKVLAMDGVYDPDILCINAASAALCMSKIPWAGPLAAVRVATAEDSSFIVFPTRQELGSSQINLVVVANANNYIVMLEGTGENASWSVLQNAVLFGLSEAQKVAEFIATETASVRRQKTRPSSPADNNHIKDTIYMSWAEKIKGIFQKKSHDKKSRDKNMRQMQHMIVGELQKIFPDRPDNVLHEIVNSIFKQVFRMQVVHDNVRQFCVARRDPSEVKKKFFNLKQRVDDPADPSSGHETADTDSKVEGVHRKADTCTKRKSQHMSKQQEATFINTVKDTQRIDLEIKTLKAQLDTMKEATAAFKSLKEMANTVNTYYQSKQVKLNTLDVQNIQFEYINNSEL